MRSLLAKNKKQKVVCISPIFVLFAHMLRRFHLLLKDPLAAPWRSLARNTLDRAHSCDCILVQGRLNMESLAPRSQLAFWEEKKRSSESQ